MTTTVLEYRAEPAVGSRYRVLMLLCVAAGISYVQRQGVGGVSATAIRADLALDPAWFGVIMGAWALGYALMQIPSGWLADRWGSRAALSTYAILWSTLTGAAGFAPGYWSLAAVWTLMGAAMAGIFPASTKAIRNWFPPERRGSANGLLASSMAVGGALAPAVTGLLLSVLTWRWILLIYAVPGILWAMAFSRWGKEPPASARQGQVRAAGDAAGDAATDAAGDAAGDAATDAAGDAATDAALDDSNVWQRIARSPSVWLLCAQQFLRAAAMIFFATWFPTFLQESRHVTVTRSGFLTAFAGGGAIIGSIVGGLVSDRVLVLTGNPRLSRQGLAVLGMSACSLLIFTSHFVQNTTLAIAIISAGTFCATFGGVSGYTVAIELGGRRSATVFSVMNMCGNFGTMLFPVTIGWIRSTTGNWDLALFIFAGIFAVDAVCWALLNPKGPLFPEGIESTMNHAAYDAPRRERDDASTEVGGSAAAAAAAAVGNEARR
jgi:MFS family permease